MTALRCERRFGVISRMQQCENDAIVITGKKDYDYIEAYCADCLVKRISSITRVLYVEPGTAFAERCSEYQRAKDDFDILTSDPDYDMDAWIDMDKRIRDLRALLHYVLHDIA